MFDVSQLLQEAKPLYLKRKKRRRQFKITASIVGCLSAVVLLTGMPFRYSVTTDLDGLYTYLYDDSSYNRVLETVDTSLPDWLALTDGVV